jgi:hypothetical protein
MSAFPHMHVPLDMLQPPILTAAGSAYSTRPIECGDHSIVNSLDTYAPFKNRGWATTLLCVTLTYSTLTRNCQAHTVIFLRFCSRTAALWLRVAAPFLRYARK